MKNKLTLAVMTALLTIGLSSVRSYAETVTFTFSNPNQTVVAGGTVTFFGTFTADAGNGEPVYLNGDAITDSPAPITVGDNYVDDTDFLLDFFTPLNPGESVSGDAFTITLPFDAPVGYIFSGNFVVEGGIDMTTTDILSPLPTPGVPDFTVTVVAGSNSPVPEPSSLMLLGTGLAGIFGTFKRKAFQSAR